MQGVKIVTHVVGLNIWVQICKAMDMDMCKEEGEGRMEWLEPSARVDTVREARRET